MLFTRLSRLLSSCLGKRTSSRARKASPPRRSTQLNLECLEERAVPAGLMGATAIASSAPTPTVLVVTHLNDSLTAKAGDGSLRGEILAAKSGDTILFSSNLAGGTINLAGALTLSTNLTINGGTDNLTISGGGKYEVFRVTQGVTDTIDHLTIANGQASFGGGIDNLGSLTLVGCTFSHDTSTVVGGGAIDNAGTLSVSGCTFQNNLAQYGDGGAIYNSGTVTDTGSTFSSNIATYNKSSASSSSNGGAIYNLGTLTDTGSSFNNNTADTGTGLGAGIYNSGTLTVSGDTFLENVAISGGGLYTSGTSAVSITGSTFNHNDAGLGVGGGIDNQGTRLTVTTSTFLFNFADLDGGGVENVGSALVSFDAFLSNISDADGGGLSNDNGTATVADSTFAGNDGSGLFNNPRGTLGLVYDTVADNSGYGLYNEGTAILQGNILISNSSGDFDNAVSSQSSTDSYNVIGSVKGLGVTGSNNQLGVTPGQVDLGMLNYYGGPTETFSLLAGSVAIGNGGAPGIWGTDQRGINRPASGADAGSFQTEGQYNVTTTLDPAGALPLGQMSLRQAVTLADQARAGLFQNILLNQSLSGQTISLSEGSLEVNSPAYVRISTAATNESVTLDGLGKSTIFVVEKGSNVELEGLTLTHGQGVLNNGSLTLFDCVFTADAASDGGSLFGGAVQNLGGIVDIISCTFSGDTADPTMGAGGAIENTGTMTIASSTFTGDSAFEGGAIFNVGTLTITGSTLEQNSAQTGGAIFNAASGTLNIGSDTFWSNTAKLGEGIYTLGIYNPNAAL